MIKGVTKKFGEKTGGQTGRFTRTLGAMLCLVLCSTPAAHALYYYGASGDGSDCSVYSQYTPISSVADGFDLDEAEITGSEGSKGQVIMVVMDM